MLRALSPEDMAQLSPLLKPVSLPLHYVFNEPGQEIRNCYFITSGMASTVAVMKDGSTSEVGVIGSEGLVGFAAMLGVGTAQNLTIVQVAGEGLRIDAEKLRVLYHQSPAFRCLVERFIWSTLAFYAQCAACNRFHSLEERMSRWLLTVRDRINDNSLPLTHEFLGQMLGAHRSTVTLALGAFERSAVLQNRRGKIELTDLARLEKSSCECLEAIRKLPSFCPGNDATTNGTVRSPAV
jgi:CRP-like cAMP-binding protein